MNHIALISFWVNNISIRCLSSYIKANGFDVSCYYIQDSITMTGLNTLISSLKERDTSLVGIQLVTDNYLSAASITKAIKEKLKLPVIWGGVHASIRPEECLRYADMVCIGEGEEALLDIAKNIFSSNQLNTTIKNVWFKLPHGIIQNQIRPLEENLDKYPPPDFDLNSQFVILDNQIENLSEKYLNKNEYGIMSSRGCPYSCQFCYNNYRRKQYSGKGKYLRSRSIENIIKELIIAKQVFKNITRIFFWDDTFITRTMDEFRKFKKLYIQNINLPFFAMAEPMAFDKEKISMLNKCGLTILQIGIQTGSEHSNKENYSRPVANKKILEIAKFLNKLSIYPIYDIIFNNPYETVNDVLETNNLLLKLPEPFIVQGFNLIFYPGTEITERALKNELITEDLNANINSTIMGNANSPIIMREKSVVSNRFYSIKFDSKEKEYAYLVFYLMKYKYIPKFIIKFFNKSETAFKIILLRSLIAVYNKFIYNENLPNSPNSDLLERGSMVRNWQH